MSGQVERHPRARGFRSAAVGARDGVGDREPEAPTAARPRLVRAAEALERTRRELGREPAAFVRHRHQKLVAVAFRRQTNHAGAVHEGVVDDCCDGALERVAVAVQPASALGRDPAALASSARSEPRRNRLEQLARFELLEPQRLAGAVEHEQPLGEPNQPLDLLRCRADHALELLRLAWPPLRQLQLRAQERERRAQLVARVGDEAALAPQALVEAVEHRVQRLTESRDLVGGGGNRQAAARGLGRDLRRLAPHRLHRAEGAAGDEVARERSQRERDRTDHEQEHEQRREHLVPVLDRVDARRRVLRDLLVERVADGEEEERPEHREQRRHRDAEDEREPEADREPAHARSR